MDNNNFQQNMPQAQQPVQGQQPVQQQISVPQQTFVSQQNNVQQVYNPQIIPPTQQPVNNYGNKQPTDTQPIVENAPKQQKQQGPNLLNSRKNNFANKNWKRIIRSIVVPCITAIITCIIVIPISNCSRNINALTPSEISINALGDDATLAEAVAAKCLPSVLSVNNYRVNKAGNEQQYATGSGVIISQDGYVLTNQHVVSGANTVKVNISGEEIVADVIGEDASTDIAVIKIKNISGLTAIDVADSDQVHAGEWVMALGNPLGLEQSVSVGIVSATGRSTTIDDEELRTTRVYYNLIQTDAAINSGNSGGALVNKEGKLVGINSVGVSANVGSGIGFAIPSNYAIEVANVLKSGGTISHASIGLAMSDITASDVQQYDLKIDSGAFVTNVSPGGPADAAGIQTGDVITEIDGEKITAVSSAIIKVKSHSPGDTINVVINRHGQKVNVNVTLSGD